MRRFLTLIIICAVALCAVAPAYGAPKKKTPARTSATVRKEQKKTAGEIKQTREKIDRNTAETRRQLKRLNALQHEIGRQKSVIDILQSRADSINRQLQLMDDTLRTTRQRVETLRQGYARTLRSSRDSRRNVSGVAFVFAADNFRQAMARTRYLRQLGEHQKAQRSVLQAQIDTLALRQKQYDELRAQLTARLQRLDSENAQLSTRTRAAESTMDSLRRSGNALQQVLRDKQRQAQRLEQELDRIIAEELRRQEEQKRLEQKRLEEQRKNASKEKPASSDTAKVKTTPKTTPGGKDPGAVEKLTGDFAANRGRLPMPVNGRYRIIGSFGRNVHAQYSRVQIQNNGIDIACAPSTTARAVFAGTVTSIFRVDGFQNIVIIRHGEYLTVYAGLDTLAVKKGQQVTAGQTLGSIYADPTDTPQEAVLHFEVRHEKQKLNPADWLR